jgi:hypothetical protein
MSDQSTTVLKGILSEGTVAFHAIFAKAFRSLPVGVFLSQAYFWQESRKYKSKETHREICGKQFFTKTAKDWFEETSLTIEQLARVREVLKSQDILEEMLVENPAKLYYHVNFNALVSVINRYIESGVSASVDNRNKNRFKTQTRRGKKPKLGSVKNQSSYNEESIESLKRVGESTPAPAENQIPETIKSEKKETDFIAPAAAPTHAVTSHDPAAPGIVTVDPVTLPMSDDEINQAVEENKQVWNAIAPPRKQKIETVDDAEAEILSWVLTETGKESVRNWYSNAARACTMQDVKDMIQDFCRVYSTIGDEGKRQRFIKEPLQFFKFTFKGFLKRQPGFERKPGMPGNQSQPERQSAISPNIRQL